MTGPRQPHLLIVDDEAACRDLLAGWLADAGYAVVTACDGLEAQARLEATAFDLVITDLRMPGCDGLALLDHVRVRRPELPVVFMSGQATLGEAIAALREGRSFDFLEKPLHDARGLWRVVARALEVSGLQAPRANASQHAGVQAALAFLAERLAEPITLGDVAAHAGYSPSYMSELIHLETGRTLSDWMTELRMERAKALLRETDMGIAEIGAAVGFGDPSHFTRRFRAVVGQPPAAWRREPKP